MAKHSNRKLLQKVKIVAGDNRFFFIFFLLTSKWLGQHAAAGYQCARQRMSAKKQQILKADTAWIDQEGWTRDIFAGVQ